MWLWWVVSLVILTSAIVFALYVFYSSYKPSHEKKKFSLRQDFTGKTRIFPVSKQQIISSLELKLQSVEHNSLNYFNELKMLQERILAVEKSKGIVNPKEKGVEDDENWQELYYKLHDDKEKMESELELTNQKLEEAESLMNEYKRRQTAWKEKRSELENEINKAQNSGQKFEQLQHDLASATAKMQELEQELEEQKGLHKNFELLQQQHAFIQSEADDLRNRIKEINNRDILLQQKISRLTELESTMEISEHEKADIKKILEEIIVENVALATKLQELQEKLKSEKYA
jgi:chromosome segregation ATPase